MDVREMMDNLGLRVEDATGSTFTDAMKLKALTNGQNKAAAFLHNNYLDELRVKESNKSLASNILAFSGLKYRVLRGEQGILKVKVRNGKYATRLDLVDLKKTENSLLASSDQNPLYYVFQQKIEMLHSVSAIDVWYMRLPNPLLYMFTMTATGTPSATKFIGDDDQGLSASDNAYGGSASTDTDRSVIYCIETNTYHVVTNYVGVSRTFTVSPGLVYGSAKFVTGYSFMFLTHDFDKLNLDGVYPDLNPSLHELMLTFAEGELWRMDKQPERATAAQKDALAQVEVLNAKYVQAEGIGTKGRK